MTETTTPSAVLADLMERFNAREAVGRAKYGTTLDRMDLTPADLRQHLLEELMDGCMYLVGEQHAEARAKVDAVDAERYRKLRVAPLGEPGVPCIALPSHSSGGTFVNLADADAAVDGMPTARANAVDAEDLFALINDHEESLSVPTRGASEQWEDGYSRAVEAICRDIRKLVGAEQEAGKA